MKKEEYEKWHFHDRPTVKRVVCRVGESKPLSATLQQICLAGQKYVTRLLPIALLLMHTILPYGSALW